MKRMTALLLASVLLTALSGFALAEADFVTLPELAQQAEAGVRGIFRVKGWDVAYDFVPEVPPAAVCPVVRVTVQGDLRHLVPADARSETVRPDEKMYCVDFDRHEHPYNLYPKDNPAVRSANDTYPRGSQAENNPMTWEEAETFFHAQAAPFLKAVGPTTLVESRARATSRMYENTATGLYSWDCPELDYSRPTTPMGYYELNYLQAFHGITLLATTAGRYPDNAVQVRERPYAEARGIISGPEDYYLSISLAKYADTLADDLPLATLDRVTREVARIVQAGYAYHIAGLRFGYLLFNDGEKPGSAFILLPVWQLQGLFVDHPGYPFPAADDMDVQLSQSTGSFHTRFINAQTARWLDPEDQTTGRTIARWIAWEDVR